MAIEIGGVKVVVELENGTLIKGLLKTEEQTKASGKRMETNLKGGTKEIDRMGKMAGDAGRKLKAMFGIGALIGAAVMGLRAFFGAVSDGIKRAAANNEAISNKMETVKGKIESAFTRIGILLLPIIDKLLTVLDKILEATGPGAQIKSIEKDIARNIEQIEKLKKASATAEDKPSGILGFIKWSKKDYQTRITEIEKENEAYRQQQRALKALDAEERKIASKKDAEKKTAELIKLTEGYNKSLVSLADQLSMAFGAEDVKKQVDELYKAATAIGEIIKQMEAAKAAGEALAITTASWVGLITAALSIVVGVAKSLTTAAYNTDEITKSTEELLAKTAAYENKIQSISTDMRKITAEMRRQKALVGDTSEEQIRLLNDEIKLTKQKIDTTRGTIASANPDQRGGLANQLAAFNAIKKQMEDEINFYKNNPIGVIANALTFGAALATSEARLKQANDIIANLNTRITAIDAIPELEADIAEYEADIAEYEAEIRNIEQERVDLVTELAEKQAQITEELKRQTEEILRQQARLGMIDVENVGDINRVLARLQAEGFSGMGLVEAAAGVGISNQAIRNTQIGSIIYNAYSASNANLNVNGVIANQTGE